MISISEISLRQTSGAHSWGIRLRERWLYVVSWTGIQFCIFFHNKQLTWRAILVWTVYTHSTQWFMFLVCRGSCHFIIIRLLPKYYEAIVIHSFVCFQTSIPVTAPSAGIIQEFFVNDGDKVEKGQQLFKLVLTGMISQLMVYVEISTCSYLGKCQQRKTMTMKIQGLDLFSVFQMLSNTFLQCNCLSGHEEQLKHGKKFNFLNPFYFLQWPPSMPWGRMDCPL